MTAQRGGGPWWPISSWEFSEIQRRLDEIADLPHGQRGRARREMAATFGVCERTLMRWATYRGHVVRCGGYEALFVLGEGRPSQVTPWEPVSL